MDNITARELAIWLSGLGWHLSVTNLVLTRYWLWTDPPDNRDVLFNLTMIERGIDGESATLDVGTRLKEWLPPVEQPLDWVIETDGTPQDVFNWLMSNAHPETLQFELSPVTNEDLVDSLMLEGY